MRTTGNFGLELIKVPVLLFDTLELMKNALLCSYTEELLRVFSITYPNWSTVSLEVATGHNYIATDVEPK